MGLEVRLKFNTGNLCQVGINDFGWGLQGAFFRFVDASNVWRGASVREFSGNVTKKTRTTTTQKWNDCEERLHDKKPPQRRR